jgi:thioredoxin-like negative regulator of GroEL
VTSLELNNDTVRKANQEALKKSNDALSEGKQLLLKKEYKEAAKLFTQALKHNRHNIDAKFYRGISHLDSNCTKKAI